MAKKHEIGLEEIKGIRIGQAENTVAGTGCTVFLSDHGMAAGMDVRGGGPASRESELLNPLAAAQVIHGIVLAGGSAFGLNAADGVMQYLEDKKDKDAIYFEDIAKACYISKGQVSKCIRNLDYQNYEEFIYE